LKARGSARRGSAGWPWATRTWCAGSRAAALSQGRINAAAAQVLAHQAAEQANRTRLAELARLEQLGEWREGRMRANAFARTMRGAALQNRAALREGLLFRIPSFYR